MIEDISLLGNGIVAAVKCSKVHNPRGAMVCIIKLFTVVINSVAL
jgi:hypothetical protein